MNAIDRDSVASPAVPNCPRRGNVFAATLAAACIGGAALAAEAPPTVRVPYGDLNLSSDAGRQALLQRLASAAHRLCDEPGTRELPRVIRADACFRETLDNAVVAVHNERLSTLYHARTGAGAT